MPPEAPEQPCPLHSTATITAAREPKVNANEAHEESLSGLERVALWVTDHVGTMGFFLVILAWTVLWMGWNALAQSLKLPGVFDTPWQFGIWLFVSNLIQIHLMPLIMVGQNLQSRHGQLRADLLYQMAEQTERESEAILCHLESIQRSLHLLDGRLAALEERA